jgi:16S rRNA C967 or C1407 C5-methylase (RsmB/RsmF family)
LVVDAPCSGEGLFRKDSEAADEWTEDNINLCSARQKRIINDVWDALKPGGIVIYSTCTYNEQENEEISNG